MGIASIQEPLVTEGEARPTPRLSSNFKWLFVANIFYATCQWGMLSVLAKAGNPSIVGQFALGLAISAPIFMFANLNLRGVQTTDSLSQFEFADYFSLRVITSFSGIVSVIFIVSLLSYDVATRVVILLLGVAKAVESLGDAVAGLLQKVERVHQVAVSLMLRGAFSLVAFGATFLLFHNLAAAVCALALSWAIVFFSYDLKRAAGALHGDKRFFRFDSRRLTRLFFLSLPMGIVMTLFSLNANVPRYLLVKDLGSAELGIFASLVYLLQALYLIVNAMGEAASARLSRMVASGNWLNFRRLIGGLALIGLAILVFGVALAALFGRPLLSLLYRPEYAQQLPVFELIMLAGGLSAIGYFLGYGIIAARCFRLLPPVIALSTLATVSLTFLLAPRMGLKGAAIAMVCASSIHLLGNAIGLRIAVGQVFPRIPGFRETHPAVSQLPDEA